MQQTTMQEVTIINNKYITVKYLPEMNCIFHEIHEPIPHLELVEALNAGSAALKQYGATKWLSDDRKNGPLAPESQAFGFNDWGPRTIKDGWKYWATVVPQQLVAAGALAPVMEAYFGLGLQLQVFITVEEAKKWLNSLA